MEIPKNWTFETKEVAREFDDHVAEQLPWYPMAQDMAAHLIRCYLPHGGFFIDLGCSTGGMTRRIAGEIDDRKITCLSVDNSREMIGIFDGVGDSECADMTDPELFGRYDVCCMFLSLMFVPVKRRKLFIAELISKLECGGAIIVVDKMTQSSGYLGTSISRMSMSNKLTSGNCADEILRKELSLCGAQRPIDGFELEAAGFDRWLQLGDFAGWIYTKDGL